MKLLPILLILLSVSILPAVAKADYVITVPDTDKHGHTYPAQTLQNYTFSLTNPPFNTSTGYNSSVWKADIKATIFQGDRLATSEKYVFNFYYNTTHTMRIEMTYHNTIGFLWSLEGNIFLDDQLICTGNHFYGFHWTLDPPSPTFEFDYSLHGRFASNPTLYPILRDNVDGEDLTCDVTGTSPTPSGVWYSSFGGLAINMNELVGAPSLNMYAGDDILHDHKLTWQFGNLSTEQTTQAAFNTASGGAGCGGIDLILICVDPLEIVNFAASHVTAAVHSFLALVGIGIFYDIVTSVFDPLVATIQLVATIVLGTGGSFGTGGIFLSLIVYVTCWGCIVASLSGNLMHIVTWPYYFAKFFIMGVAYGAYFMFVWLPMRLWQILVAGIGALGNLISGLKPWG